MKKYNYVVSTLLAVFLIPVSSHAAMVFVQSTRNSIAVGDTAVVTVKIDAQGAVLNTVDGEVSFSSKKGSLSVQEFSLANSSFGLWPRTPSLSADGRTVSFVGGVPGGFSIEGATLFNIVVRADKEGDITIAPQNLSVFSNDGKGTKVAVQTKALTIAVTPKPAGQASTNDWAAVVSADTVPPEPFIVVLGQDPSIYDGKKFAFFSAIDNQSGIDHYEVSENGGQVVRTGSTYVLQDQQGTPTLNVVAYDKAGNKRTASSSTPSTAARTIPVVIIVLILIYALRKFYQQWKGSKAI